MTQLRAEPELREGGVGEESERKWGMTESPRVSECAGMDGRSASAQNRVRDEE